MAKKTTFFYIMISRGKFFSIKILNLIPENYLSIVLAFKYGAPKVSSVTLFLFRIHEILFRNFEITFRKNEITFRIYAILFRKNEIIFRNYEIKFRKKPELLFRKNELLFRKKNIFLTILVGNRETPNPRQ